MRRLLKTSSRLPARSFSHPAEIGNMKNRPFTEVEMKTRKTLFACDVFLALLFLLPTFALSQAPYYQGKTITIIQGRSPGGAGDMRVRAVIPLLQKHIPGKPTIVSEYISGGGGRKAANHMYKGARPDGARMANIGEGFVN